MSSFITGIHHAALKCGSLEKFNETISFYRDVLGLELLRTWGEGEASGAMLSTGSGLIEIFANGELLPTGAVHHFALATNDPDGCVEAVRKAGYPITVEPKEICLPSQPPLPARIAFCMGPVGETIEFFYEKSLDT